MILTVIPDDQLGEILDRFMAKIEDPFARAAFRLIRATSADRAAGAAAERHRQTALLLARSLGMAIYPEAVECAFNWDGAALNSATEAYVILHEAAHFALAPPERRRLIDFGLGPGPDTRDRDAAERAAVLCALAREEDEAPASLLGIIWEAKLGQPALASFLDQNWLEGLDRAAPSHFTAVLGRLRLEGMLDLIPLVLSGTAKADRKRRAAAARAVQPGSGPDPSAEGRGGCAGLGAPRRSAKPASIPSPGARADNPSLTDGFPDRPSEPPTRPR